MKSCDICGDEIESTYQSYQTVFSIPLPGPYSIDIRRTISRQLCTTCFVADPSVSSARDLKQAVDDWLGPNGD